MTALTTCEEDLVELTPTYNQSCAHTVFVHLIVKKKKNVNKQSLVKGVKHMIHKSHVMIN